MDNNIQTLREIIMSSHKDRDAALAMIGRIESGENVVLYESEYGDADGVLNAEAIDGTSRPMLVKEVKSLDFVPNPDWVSMCVSSHIWSLARGRDTIMWNTCFPKGGK